MRVLSIAAALALATGLGACNTTLTSCSTADCGYASPSPAAPQAQGGGAAPFDDPVADYTRRSLTISPGAGNAIAANQALQTASPWPQHSGNTAIPGNGPQMVRAINEYENGTRTLQPASGAGSPSVQITNVSGSSGASGSSQ